MRSLRISLYALGIVLLVTGLWLLPGQWYHDDACTIEEWKCDLGTLGFAGFFLGLISIGACALWVAAELFARLGGRETPRRSGLAEIGWAAVCALVLVALPWLAFALAEGL